MDLIRTLVCLAVLALATPATADGRLAPQGGTITSVGATAGGGLTGGATGGPAYLGLITTCSSGQVLAWSGSAWACTANGGGVATVTATAGGGVTIGGTTSNPTVGLQTSCGSGKLLVWSGSAWGCSTFSEASSTLSIPEAVSLTGANITILQSNVLTLTAFASASSALNSRVSGTVNVTAGDLSASGASFVSNTTKSGGAHILTDYGLLSEANGQSSAEHAYAIWAYGHGGTVDNYDFVGFGGQLLQNDAATFGSTVAVAGALTETTRRVFSNPGSGLARDGTNAYQINLNITPTTCRASSSRRSARSASAPVPRWRAGYGHGERARVLGDDVDARLGRHHRRHRLHVYVRRGRQAPVRERRRQPRNAKHERLAAAEQRWLHVRFELAAGNDRRAALSLRRERARDRQRGGGRRVAIDRGCRFRRRRRAHPHGGRYRSRPEQPDGLARDQQRHDADLYRGPVRDVSDGRGYPGLRDGADRHDGLRHDSGWLGRGNAHHEQRDRQRHDVQVGFDVRGHDQQRRDDDRRLNDAVWGATQWIDRGRRQRAAAAARSRLERRHDRPFVDADREHPDDLRHRTVKSTATFEAQILVKGAIKATGAWAGRFTASGTTATNTLPTPSGTYFCLTDTDETTRGYAHSVASTTLSWSSLTSGNHYEFICIDN